MRNLTCFLFIHLLIVVLSNHTNAYSQEISLKKLDKRSVDDKRNEEKNIHHDSEVKEYMDFIHNKSE